MVPPGDLTSSNGTTGGLLVNDVHTGVGVVRQRAVAVAKRVVGALGYPIVNALTALGDGLVPPRLRHVASG